MIKMIRKRFTIPEHELKLIMEYVQLDHRSFSELICEALCQIRHRYPKKVEKARADKLHELERKVELLYKQVHSQGNVNKVRDEN